MTFTIVYAIFLGDGNRAKSERDEQCPSPSILLVERRASPPGPDPSTSLRAGSRDARRSTDTQWISNCSWCSAGSDFTMMVFLVSSSISFSRYALFAFSAFATSGFTRNITSLCSRCFEILRISTYTSLQMVFTAFTKPVAWQYGQGD